MFSGLTNQMNSWMGAVKGEGEEGNPNADAPPPQQPITDVAGEASEQTFENIPVGEDGEKLTR